MERTPLTALLEKNTYPGRGIMIGRSADGKRAVTCLLYTSSGPRLIWYVGYTDEKAARALPVQLFRCHHTNLLFIRRGVFSSWSDYIIAVVYADLETSV